MRAHRHNKTPWLIFASLLFVLLCVAYAMHRQQVFEVLAAGTQWVLVTCGFEPEGEETQQSDRLRKLYYAARMFNQAPPRELLAEDQLAAERYPGMGFGLVHTFDVRPVSVVIGGWLFSVPCTYFADARDCDKALTTVRLKVSAASFKPISLATIESFLAVGSPDIIRVTVAGLNSAQAGWWREHASDEGYQLQALPGFRGEHDGLVCTEAEWIRKSGVLDHCLLRYMHNADVMVEVMFGAVHLSRWEGIRRETEELVGNLQVRQ